MPVSHYFNNYSGVPTSEQGLMEDVIVESIKIMGHDCHYLPRESWNGDDTIFGENVNSKFSRAYTIEMYLANTQGYEGDGDFFSKFGLEIRDTSNFIVSRKAFERYVPKDMCTRPREGDLIYVPVLRKIFEIKFVEEELMFFSLGKSNPFIYELRCELFRYSNEQIDTGIDEVDIVEDRMAYTIELNMHGGTGNYFNNEMVYQGANLAYSTASAEINNWNPSTKVLHLMNVRGEFVGGQILIGDSSNTRYTITNYDTMGDFVDYDIYDNRQIQTEANTLIDTTEVNPFGMP